MKTIDTIFRMVQKIQTNSCWYWKVVYQAVHFVEKEMITRNTWFTVTLEAKEKKELYYRITN